MQSIPEEALEERKENSASAANQPRQHEEKHARTISPAANAKQIADQNERLWTEAIKKYKKKQEREQIGKQTIPEQSQLLSAQLGLKKELMSAQIRFRYRQTTGHEMPSPATHHARKPRR